MNKTQNLAKLILNYSLKVKPNQLVMIRSETTAMPLIQACYEEILKLGARPLMVMTFPGADYLFYKNASDDVIKTVTPYDKALYENVDALIAIDCDANTAELSNVDHSRVAEHRKSKMPLRDIWDKKEAEGKFKWVVVGYPSPAMAQNSGMSMSEYTDFVYAACGCELSDPVKYWQDKSKEMDNIKKKLLDGAKELHYVGYKTDIRISVEGRKWVLCDGGCNMPDGEIFTSPVEDSANGEIYFDVPTTYNGVEAKGIHLKIKNGKIYEATAEVGNEFLQAMINMDDGSKFIGEVAFGLNDFIQKPGKNILFDEKIGGTIHFAVGASYPETGGKNKSGLHWDMVKEMKNGGYLEVDGKKVYENGKFLM